MTVERIGYKIKKLREFNNYTQEYMAEQLGISQGAYSHIEKDGKELSLSRISRIAEVLNIKLEDLLNLEDKFVFHGYDNSQNGQVYNTYQQSISEEVKQLFEDKLKLQEELLKAKDREIELLKKLMEK